VIGLSVFFHLGKVTILLNDFRLWVGFLQYQFLANVWLFRIAEICSIDFYAEERAAIDENGRIRKP